MESVLTEHEVRELLKPTPGGATPPAARPVDLVARDHRAFDILPDLQAGMEELADRVALIYTREWRAEVEVKPEPAQVLPASRMEELIAPARFIYSVAAGDGELAGAVAIDAFLGNAFILRQFGGAPGVDDRDYGKPSPIERRVVARLAREVLAALEELVEPLCGVKLALSGERARLGADLAVVTLAFHAQQGERESSLTLALSTASLEPRHPRLPRRAARPAEETLLPSLLATEVELSVVLGRCQLPLRRLMALRPGDLLTLDTTVNSPAPLLVQGRPKFVGRPAVRGGGLAIEITGPASAAGAA